MIVPARLPVDLQALPIERLGRGEVAPSPGEQCEVAQTGCGLVVFLPEHLLSNRQGFPVEGLRALVVTEIAVDPAEIDQRNSNIRVLRAQKLAAHLERFLEDR